MKTNFCWFTVAVLSAVAVLPVRAQVQVQNTDVRGGNGVNYVRAARRAPPRSFTGSSFLPAPIRRPMFNAARIQNINGGQRIGSIGPRPTVQPPQYLVAPNLGNQQSATASASGTLNLNFATNRVASSSDPAPHGASSNQQLPQANNSSHAAGSARNHVFAQRSANWHSDWDHNHDHWWHGHLCHFVNNVWVIFEVGFYPWWPYDYPYDYYYDSLPEPSSPYTVGSIQYYTPSEYEPNGQTYIYNPNDYTDRQNGGGYYDQGQYGKQDDNSSSSADRDIAVETVAAAQDELAREGYYHGPIDGVFSEDAHRAVKDFQRDNGLNETGYLSRETRNALELDVK
jgi:peptidoglycan hydrolase-like protein with peptidoglycan-binding domain